MLCLRCARSAFQTPPTALQQLAKIPRTSRVATQTPARYICHLTSHSSLTYTPQIVRSPLHHTNTAYDLENITTRDRNHNPNSTAEPLPAPRTRCQTRHVQPITRCPKAAAWLSITNQDANWKEDATEKEIEGQEHVESLGTVRVGVRCCWEDASKMNNCKDTAVSR